MIAQERFIEKRLQIDELRSRFFVSFISIIIIEMKRDLCRIKLLLIIFQKIIVILSKLIVLSLKFSIL